MKRIALCLGIAAMAASCTIREEAFPVPAEEEAIFFGSFEQPEGTRVYVNEDGLFRWNANDRVSIFNKITYNQQYRFAGKTGDDSGGFRKVDADDFITGRDISHVVSVYPYQESTSITEDEVLTLTLPAEQSYAGNTFGLGANTMVSVSSDNVLRYKNACGYLLIKLYGEKLDISSVTLKGNNGEILAGEASVTMSPGGIPSVTFAENAATEITLTCATPVRTGNTAEESTQFWFVVPPVTFSKGFTVTVNAYPEGVMERSTSKRIPIERNKLSRMSPMELPSLAAGGDDFIGYVKDTATGSGIPGVTVSDGYSCVSTDENGYYSLKSNERTRLLYYSTPAEYKIACPEYPGLPVFYKAVKPDGFVQRNDFFLDPLPDGKETDWFFLGIGDPQCQSDDNVSRFVGETIPDITKMMAGHQRVYAMTLGDIIFDSNAMWPAMQSSMASVNNGNAYIPFFQTIGNHDHDATQPDTSDDLLDDYNATALFEDRFGPTDYSFNRGDVHIVSIDNVPVSSASRNISPNRYVWNYSAGLTRDKYEWLKADLALVPDKARKAVILCMHIPMRAGANGSGGSNFNLDKYYSEVLDLLTQFREVHIMTGHTHYTQNYIHENYVCQGGLPIYEHIHGAVSGAWWSCRSTVTGEPAGYTVYDIQGPHIRDWCFKGTDRDVDFQLRVFDGNEIYYPDKQYPLNWYTESQPVRNMVVRGNKALKGCFVLELFNDDDSYWSAELRSKGTGRKIGDFVRLPNGSCSNVAIASFFFNELNKATDTFANKTASHYWYYKPSSESPADEKDWEVVVTERFPGSSYSCVFKTSTLTTQKDFESTF